MKALNSRQGNITSFAFQIWYFDYNLFSMNDKNILYASSYFDYKLFSIMINAKNILYVSWYLENMQVYNICGNLDILV